MALDVHHIVRTALSLLNEEGLDGLSTRRLAAELNVTGPALYHHFPNKGELLGHMVCELLLDSMKDIDWSWEWSEILRFHAIALRKVLLSYRDSARVFVSSSPTEMLKSGVVPRLTAPLIRAGFSIDAANAACSTTASFVIGWMFNEENMTIRNYMSSFMDMDKGYTAGLDIVISGIRSQRDRPEAIGRIPCETSGKNVPSRKIPSEEQSP